MINELNELEVRNVTVNDYLRARDLMTEERGIAWRRHECEEFRNDKLGELVEVYDFIIDTLTCLAIELDNKNKQ